jgi:phage-related protein
MDAPRPKPLAWAGSTRQDMRQLPEPVQDDFGYSLYLAQIGGKHRRAKPLSGFGGAGVLEVVDDYDGDTFRAVYTVRFAECIYVLHVFQKKSWRGISTPAQEIALIRRRLTVAQEQHQTWLAQEE